MQAKEFARVASFYPLMEPRPFCDVRTDVRKDILNKRKDKERQRLLRSNGFEAIETCVGKLHSNCKSCRFSNDENESSEPLRH